jgi:hypothetical protein
MCALYLLHSFSHVRSLYVIEVKRDTQVVASVMSYSEKKMVNGPIQSNNIFASVKLMLRSS